MAVTHAPPRVPRFSVAWSELFALRDRLANRHLPELMIGGLAVISVGLGVTMIAVPQRFGGLATYRIAFMIVPVWGWALAWALLGVWLAVGGLARRTWAIPPALLLAVVYGAFSVLCAFAVADRGVPFAVLFSAGFSWWGIVAAIAGSARKPARDDT